MDCNQCGACCTEISISSPMVGLPFGKPAGVRCPHLKENNLCSLFNSMLRPAVCSSFQANEDICGSNNAESVQKIRWYENATKPE